MNTDTSGVQNIVEPLDETVDDTLDTVGGAVGAPNLGNTVNQTVSGATNGLLGGGDTGGGAASLGDTASQTVSGAVGVRTRRHRQSSANGVAHRAAARSVARLRSSQRSATPWSSGSCWAERWWPPGIRISFFGSPALA